MIDGRDYSPNIRGLNFVVFDMVTKELLDAVNFDTYSDNFCCNRPSSITDGLLDYKCAHPKVSVICFNMPNFPDENLSDNEKFIRQYDVKRGTILENINKPLFALNKYFTSPEEISEVLNAPKSYLDINGVRRFEDIRGRYLNISGGHSVTICQPVHYKHTIYIVGGCTVFGNGSSDKGTIASHLQRLFNSLAPEQEVIVQNYGFYLMETDTKTNEKLTILNSLPVRAGNIVLCGFGINDKLPNIDMRDAAKHPHNYGEVFFDTGHYTEDGNRLIADKLFEMLRQKDFFSYIPSNLQNCSLRTTEAGSNYTNLSDAAQKNWKHIKKYLLSFTTQCSG